MMQANNTHTNVVVVVVVLLALTLLGGGCTYIDQFERRNLLLRYIRDMQNAESVHEVESHRKHIIAAINREAERIQRKLVAEGR